ncbi:hypothetical protein DQ04_00021190 [Trypanosoma grayi]|uniref:hypothetical protein n=1 Tax=Trypanosoma grayi TaxID=71804 RepID=UPI0004F48FFA|nr:hypothetical protein DQ04_00021190 [Trypanosoma grayi]KEG15621.1 hypothetical protein DQ04_00021190 [Trypanosoma grayi]
MACVVSSADNAKAVRSHAGEPAGFNSAERPRLTVAEAEAFYREECKCHAINPNNTFSKQLLAGATIFDFDNGYLGGRGIVPIVSTLQRLPVVELSMRSCEVTTDDIALICKTFASHETLRKIDLRGISLTVASARKLLALVVQNSHVTQILLDEETPKYLYIQRQCFANANMTILASRCLVCSKSVIHSPDQKVESRLLQSLGDEFQHVDVATGGVALEVFFSCLLACCEANDGVLFLCSSECRIQLTNDILMSMRAVVCEWFCGTKGAWPKNPILRRCIVNTLKKLAGRPPEQQGQVVSGRMGGHKASGPSDSGSDNSSSDDDSSIGCDGVLEECTICGTHAVCLPDGAHLAMRQICEDIEGGCSLRPSALLRLAKLMIVYAEMHVCNKKCVVHLVRFGMYGYGGVLQSRTVCGAPHVTSLGLSLMELPDEDFSVLNFSMAHVDELEEEDTCCALTVASAMSDIDGVTIDPYMIFATGRHLAKLQPETVGMELRHACDAVQVFGCLPASMGPFDRRKERPPRKAYVSWEEWGDFADVKDIVRVAFSRRRNGFYVVDGPHNSIFDNTRAALWAFRKQRRAVLVVMKFCLDWIVLPGGVVPNEASLNRPFLTTFKIVGQANIDNSFYVICQGNFGSRVGNHGFFYIPRGIFNLHVSGSAYMFLDSGIYAECKGSKAKLYAAQILPKTTVELAEKTALLQELHYYCREALNWRTRHRLDGTKIVCDAFNHVPPSLFFLYRSCDRHITDAQLELLETLLRMCFSDTSRSMRLFYVNEVLGPRAAEWISGLAESLAQLPPYKALLQRAAEVVAPSDLERSQARLQWKSLGVGKTQVINLPQRPKGVMNKKALSRRPVRKIADKGTGKETRDTFRTKLEQRWSSVRDENDLLKTVRRRSQSTGTLIGIPLLRTSVTTTLTARAMALGSDTVPPSLVGQPWHAVRLCNADGSLTEYTMFFIKDHVCCFNLANQTITMPLHSMHESANALGYPFPTGFDCALNSPVNPRVAYFFCGGQWIEWDTYMQTCTGGPFKLKFHRQFEALPEEFCRRIDAAVPVPSTSCVLFFSQLNYVVFDMEQQRPISNVRRIGAPESLEGDVPTFATSLAKLFPCGPMATLLMLREENNMNATDDEDQEIKNGTMKSMKQAVMLIGRDGHLALVCDFAPSAEKTKAEQLQTLPTSPLARLPLALRQMTTAALQNVCKNALSAECNRCCIVVSGTHQSSSDVISINSTFTQQCENVDALLSLTRCGAAETFMPLLRDEVVFAQTPESILGSSSQIVEVDYGVGCPVSFGVVIVVLDTTCIDPRILCLAPIEAVVESSDDGVTYIQHTRFIATPYVTAVCWGEVHVARFWRVRFLTRVPVGTGVVRLLWYEVARALGTELLDPTTILVPHASAAVQITAPNVFCAPKDLLNSLEPGAVFSSPPRSGWFKKHCILPLLPDGAFCLMFCGSSFVELDCERNMVVSQRAVALADHPAFANLPHPFSTGFDAVFYPNLRNPNTVALIHGGNIILWNLQLGTEENSAGGNSVSFFKGMPWSIDEFEDVVQIWDRPGEVFVIRSHQVVHWSINTSEILNGPMLLRDCPHLYHEEFEGKSLLCVVSFPFAPNRFYVFSENCVATHTVVDGVISDCVKPVPVRQFDLFSPATLYLLWGMRRYDCVIQLDFKEEQPLLSGMIMRSSEPCGDEWLLEYSDDGLEWSVVGRHRQSSGRSRTMWGLASVDHQSHRLWRLTADASKKYGGEEEQMVLYTNLLLLTLPSAPYRVSPQRVALSGTLNGPVSALFQEKATVAFENSVDAANTGIPQTNHVTLDYGDVNPPNIMAFACQCTGDRVNATWRVWCSDDGEQWENCGIWRSRFRYFKTSWRPRGPRQYWRIELQSWESSTLYENFRLFEYTGPSLLLENSTPLGEGWDPSMMWEKTSEGCKFSPMMFSAQVGSAIVLDNKQNITHVVGVRMVSHGQQVTSTKFAVEFSSNAVDWRAIDASLLLRGGSGQAVWEGVEYYRYLRLRIVQHTGPSSLMLRDICFEASKPSLYHAVESANAAPKPPSCELNLSGELKEIVAVQAFLPPSSIYAVERLSPDGSTWEELAKIENNDIMNSKMVRQGWPPQGGSSNWRLSPAALGISSLDSEANGGSIVAVSPPLGRDAFVRWYAFTGKTIVKSNFVENSNAQVTTNGFVEVQAAKRLMENKSETVVLRSADFVTLATVTWFFDNGVMPRFHQVSLEGRTATNPNSPPPTPPPPPPPPQLDASSKTSSSNRKTAVRQKVNVPEVEEVKVEEVKEDMIIVVETSGNGIDYLPIAERPFSQLGNSLSWQVSMAASYWQIRFKGIPKKDYLELREVSWFVERGVTAVLAPQASCMLSNPMYEAWQSAAFNDEKEFCQMCRKGYDQAKSVASGLREPGDIERIGRVAQKIISFKAEYVGFVAKTSKEATKDQNPPEDKFISIGRPLSNDLMYQLYRAAKRYECNVDELNSLIAHPMLFGRDYARGKDDLSWFYPKFEQSGTLVESFYGFHNVRASLCILWSLSLQLQWNTDLLKDPSMTPLSPHLASVLVTVNINQSNWISAEHFPGLPLLYHAGFTERPVVIVFVLNPMAFTSKYNLTIPGMNPFPAKYPFNLQPGVNFIQYIALATCPCPVFDRLQLLYSKEFLAKYETEVVFSAPSMNSDTATVRFTLPGDGINLAVQGLCIGSIEFEVQLKMEDGEEKYAAATTVTQRQFENPHKISFVTHDTVFVEESSAEPPMQLSLSGSISNDEDVIAICGFSPSARFPTRYRSSNDFVTDVRIYFSLVAGELPQSFVEPSFTLEGVLTTPSNGNYTCRFNCATLLRSYESMSVHVVGLQLAKLVQLGDHLVDAPPRKEGMGWLQTVPIFISAELQTNFPMVEFFGRGAVQIAGVWGDASISVSAKGTGISATFKSVHLGGVCLQGKSGEEGIVMSITTPVGASPVLRIDGYSCLLAPRPYPMKVEISHAGVMCVSTGVLYDLCIEEDSHFPSGVYAQVTMSAQIIMDCLTEMLQETPLIVTLMAKGIPFSLDVEEVLVEECMLERQLIFLTVRGVMLGCRFDVMVSVEHPDNTLQEARRICQGLLPRIIEQCDESLWASYDMFVGYMLRLPPPERSEGEEEAKENEEAATAMEDGEVSPAMARHLVKELNGRFIGHWMSRECELLDETIQDDFDAAGESGSPRGLDHS